MINGVLDAWTQCLLIVFLQGIQTKSNGCQGITRTGLSRRRVNIAVVSGSCGIQDRRVQVEELNCFCEEDGVVVWFLEVNRV
jgi:hypothetical protein